MSSNSGLKKWTLAVTGYKRVTTGEREPIAKNLELVNSLLILGKNDVKEVIKGPAPASTILAKHIAAPDCTSMFSSPIASNNGSKNRATNDEAEPALEPSFR
ncbi:hypothetical protein CARUB_v10007489mg [Capsella rubella]|uniref:Uncharacterized protein n=1 Tax=Capsella rubella TaxID=81985 RepID=R0FAV0_9BRAS|nr:hypothetical protein CARUB_v10007489mg [Capsella rubella]